MPPQAERGGLLLEWSAAFFAVASIGLALPAAASPQSSPVLTAPEEKIVSDASRPRDEGCGSPVRPDVRLAICLRFGWPHARTAQQGSFQIEEISGTAGTAIPIRIKLPEDVVQPDARRLGPVFLMFRGLPPEITLSAGFRVRDSWAVSLRDVPNLSMIAPPAYRGSYTLTVTLHKGKNNPPDTLVLAVRLAPGAAQAAPPEQPPVAIPPPVTLATNDPSAATTSIVASSERLGDEEETTLLAKAAEMLRSGDIEAARLVYSELVTHGSGKAAFLMAQSYDPQILAGRFVVGLQPDLEQAKQWYSRAAGLGDGDAKERLKVLQLSE